MCIFLAYLINAFDLNGKLTANQCKIHVQLAPLFQYEMSGIFFNSNFLFEGYVMHKENDHVLYV